MAVCVGTGEMYHLRSVDKWEECSDKNDLIVIEIDEADETSKQAMKKSSICYLKMHQDLIYILVSPSVLRFTHQLYLRLSSIMVLIFLEKNIILSANLTYYWMWSDAVYTVQASHFPWQEILKKNNPFWVQIKTK